MDLIDGSFMEAMRSIKNYDFLTLTICWTIYTQDVHQALVVALFVILAWVASSSVHQITEDIRNGSEVFSSSGAPRAMGWRRSYCAVFDFVQEIDRFFGPILFVYIGIHYVSIGVMSFDLFIVSLKGEQVELNILLYVLKTAILMTVIIFGTRNMGNKASEFWLTSLLIIDRLWAFISPPLFETGVRLGRRTNHPSLLSPLQSVGGKSTATKQRYEYYMLLFVVQIVKEFVAEILQNPLKIVPMGIFEVNPQLIPTVAHIGHPLAFLLNKKICLNISSLYLVFQHGHHERTGYDPVRTVALVKDSGTSRTILNRSPSPEWSLINHNHFFSLFGTETNETYAKCGWILYDSVSCLVASYQTNRILFLG